MTRDELIAAAMEAAQSITNPARPLFDEDDEAQVEAVVDAVEPLIRADEQAKRTAAKTESGTFIRSLMLADLRAKVEALRDEAMDHHWADAIVDSQTVLNLIDGAGMSDHDPPRRWVEVGADAICVHVRSYRSPGDREALLYCLVCERTTMTALRAVLPLIDSLASSGIRAERHVLADLRAQVEALPEPVSYNNGFGSGWAEAKRAVLALFDGSSDE